MFRCDTVPGLCGTLLVAALLAGCGGGHGHDDGHSHAPAGHGPHTAPPGSTGVAIGDHLAHLAVSVDAATGTLTVRVYDGGFTSPVRVTQQDLVIRVLMPPGEFVDVTCAAQADPLSGETVGNTSTFKGQADDLKTLTQFDAVVQELHVRGQMVKALKFPFPAGIKLH